MFWPFQKRHVPPPEGYAEVIGRKDYTVVVRLMERQFPAAALQGDVLLAWKMHIDEIIKRLPPDRSEELFRAASALQGMITHAFRNYNDVCIEHRMGGFKRVP